MLQKGLEGVRQNLVRAVANEHLLGRDVAAGRNRLAQACGVRIGIEAQPFRGRGDRRQHVRRGRIGVLVGIELDDAVLLRLLAGDVGAKAYGRPDSRSGS